MHFHIEQDEESVSSFYMNYESEEDYFVLPNLLMKNSNVFVEIIENVKIKLRTKLYQQMQLVLKDPIKGTR